MDFTVGGSEDGIGEEYDIALTQIGSLLKISRTVSRKISKCNAEICILVHFGTSEDNLSVAVS